jgi:hypothetical protein
MGWTVFSYEKLDYDEKPPHKAGKPPHSLVFESVSIVQNTESQNDRETDHNFRGAAYRFREDPSELATKPGPEDLVLSTKPSNKTKVQKRVKSAKIDNRQPMRKWSPEEVSIAENMFCLLMCL